MTILLKRMKKKKSETVLCTLARKDKALCKARKWTRIGHNTRAILSFKNL